MDTPDVPLPSAGRAKKRVRLTREQWSWIAACMGVPPISFLLLLLLRPAYEAVLLNNPLGQRMAGYAVAIWLAGLGIQALLFCLINQHLDPDDAKAKRKRQLLSLAVGIFGLVVFIAPTIFTIVVGPAAINIRETYKESFKQ